MHWLSTRFRYGAVAQTFHWLTVVLVIAGFFLGPGGSEQRVYSLAKDADRQLHETLGLTVVTLAIIRLAWRAFDVSPDDPPMPPWMTLSARVLHAALYVLLFLLPITAISGAWLEGHPVTLLVGIEIPSALVLSHDTGATIASIHTWLGDAILWVAALHALAGLYHHFVLKDDVLESMLPPWLPFSNPKRD